jgi:uncharacterized membrane protein YdjX (TVP38/TMEM64 family)
MKSADNKSPPRHAWERYWPLARPQLLRWLPLLLIAAAVALAWGLGWARYLSLSAIAENREGLRSLVSGHLLLSLAVYAVVYFVATALFLPGAALLTVLGGFLFGWAVAAPVTVVSATLGATLLFLVARTSFGDLLARRGGGIVRRLASGFAENAFSYLLFLRLVPLFPFFIVNIAPAFCNIKTRTFVLATMIGIIPATIAYAALGAGLDSIIETELLAYQKCLKAHGANCAFAFHPASLLKPELLAAFLFLGVMALLAPWIKRLKGRA